MQVGILLDRKQYWQDPRDRRTIQDLTKLGECAYFMYSCATVCEGVGGYVSGNVLGPSPCIVSMAMLTKSAKSCSANLLGTQPSSGARHCVPSLLQEYC